MLINYRLVCMLKYILHVTSSTPEGFTCSVFAVPQHSEPRRRHADSCACQVVQTFHKPRHCVQAILQPSQGRCNPCLHLRTARSGPLARDDTDPWCQA